MYRIAHLIVPCPSHKKTLNVKFYHFANADASANPAARSSAIPLPVYLHRQDGWMDDLRFYVLFNSISVISGRCLDEDERLGAMELRLLLRRFHLERGSNSVR